MAPNLEGQDECCSTGSCSASERRETIRHGKRLEYFTIVWNSLEALIAILSGFLAGSVALVGFGFDSVIEVTSGVALLWRLHLDSGAERERAERITLRIVGVCFIALGIYVACDSVGSLLYREEPAESPVGVALAAVSLIVMPLLARAKRRVAVSINSAALSADARQTQLCTYLSGILLGGLALNAIWGLWWADPVAALIMLPIIFKEGFDALRGKTCCC